MGTHRPTFTPEDIELPDGVRFGDNNDLVVVCPADHDGDPPRPECICRGTGQLVYPTIEHVMTMEDVAEFCGLAKDTIRQYYRKGEAGLPKPATTISRAPVWRGRQVEGWRKGRYGGRGRSLDAFPTLVGVMNRLDVAEYCGLSDQTIRRYQRRREAGIPAPVVTISLAPVWEFLDVKDWDDNRLPPHRPSKALLDTRG